MYYDVYDNMMAKKDEFSKLALEHVMDAVMDAWSITHIVVFYFHCIAGKDCDVSLIYVFGVMEPVFFVFCF